MNNKNNKLKINTQGGKNMKTLTKMLVVWCWCMCTMVLGKEDVNQELEPIQQKITHEMKLQIENEANQPKEIEQDVKILAVLNVVCYNKS